MNERGPSPSIEPATPPIDENSKPISLGATNNDAMQQPSRSGHQDQRSEAMERKTAKLSTVGVVKRIALVVLVSLILLLLYKTKLPMYTAVETRQGVASSSSSTTSRAQSAVVQGDPPSPTSGNMRPTTSPPPSPDFSATTGTSRAEPSPPEPTITSFSNISASSAFDMATAEALIDNLERQHDTPGVTALPTHPTVDTMPSTQRFLTMEVVYNKYGLTNVLMSVAGMLAYASYDDRVAVMPQKSPTHLETLLDLEATQQRLLAANVRIVTNKDVTTVWRKVHPEDTAGTTHWKSAKKLGFSIGGRGKAGSDKKELYSRAWYSQAMVRNRTHHVQFLAHRDFFLGFPFRYTAPLDLCFYLRRFVFASPIREKSKLLLKNLVEEKGIRRLATIHLRIEHDAVVTLNAAIKGISGDTLRRFMEDEVIALAKQNGCDGVYVCAGRLSDEYMQVLKSVSMPVFTKSDFPALNIALSGGREDKTVVTNHQSAGVDLLIMQVAAVAVSSKISSFGNFVHAKRCQSPDPAVQFGAKSLVQRFRNSSIVKVSESDGSETESRKEDSLPSALRKADDRGVYMYGFESKLDGSYGFSKLVYAGCHRPWNTHCFHHGEKQR